MANLPLAFGELLGGGIFLVAGITGSSLADVIDGKVTMHPLNVGGGGGGGLGSGVSALAGQVAKAMFPGATFGRTDQGVDLTMSPGTPIHAPAPSKLVGVISNWYAGQPYVWYQITSGPDSGKYYYVAEQFSPVTTQSGATFNAGDVIGHYASSGTAIEAGWATASGQTLAQSTTGYSEGQATTAGQDFRKWLGV